MVSLEKKIVCSKRHKDASWIGYILQQEKDAFNPKTETNPDDKCRVPNQKAISKLLGSNSIKY
jgi:hypothetical protein